MMPIGDEKKARFSAQIAAVNAPKVVITFFALRIQAVPPVEDFAHCLYQPPDNPTDHLTGADHSPDNPGQYVFYFGEIFKDFFADYPAFRPALRQGLRQLYRAEYPLAPSAPSWKS